MKYLGPQLTGLDLATVGALSNAGVGATTLAALTTTYLAGQHKSQLVVVTDLTPQLVLSSDGTRWLKMDGTTYTTDPVMPTSVSVAPASLQLPINNTQALVATVLPAGANQAITWSSSTPLVAVSSAGLVSNQGGSVGTSATITAKTSNGLTATVTVTITAAQTIKALGRWNPMNDGVVTGPAGSTVYYFDVKMRTADYDATGMAFDFPAWYTLNTNTGVGTDLPNDLAFLEVAVQTSTVSAPVQFSGARTGTAAKGANIASDMVSPAALGFTGGVIPGGTDVRLNGKITIPSGGKIPTSPRNLYGQSNIAAWFYDPTVTTVPSVDTLGTASFTGTKPTDSGNLYAPIMIGTYKDPAVSAFAGYGDSIQSGYNDLSLGYLGGGYFQRALGKFAKVPASINFGISGAKSTSLLTDPRILAYFKYVPDGLHVMVGTNDFGISTPPSAASIIANIDAFISRYKGASGVKAGVKAVVSRLLPRTTSTDQYVTEANQSINVNWNPGEVVSQFNALITSSKYDAILPNDVVRGTDISKWAVNGTAQWPTQDGTHPGGNAGGAPLLASAAVPVLQSAWG